MSGQHALLKESALGKETTYITQYEPNLLFAIPRALQRRKIGLEAELPFQGSDIWNAYELSWLNRSGKPIVAYAEFIFPCTSSHLIESKSFKLYLNSFNQTKFESFSVVATTLQQDLSVAAKAPVTVKLLALNHSNGIKLQSFDGIGLDDLEIVCDTYQPEPAYLATTNEIVSETLYSNLLKSNCPATGLPDWGSLQIIYTGEKINREGLLQYIVSLREHEEFHEQCVERIFVDIMARCHPEKLLVYARYTRRGGLDINPYRANYKIELANARLDRQ